MAYSSSQRQALHTAAHPPQNRTHGVQATLFGRGEGQKVVSIAPEIPAAPTRRETPKRTHQHRATDYPDLQQKLPFTAAEPQARRHADTSIEAVIYCSDPVASIMHRTLATVADIVMVLIAVGLFAIAFSLCGGEIKFDRNTILVYAAIPFLIGMFYKLLWAIAGADSPGMVWAGLHTVNFDGKRPGPQQRLIRLFGGCLGIAAIAIGFVWAFVDEETLTWHDHISNTFATPV
jgi:uncharacterized RDD family membrane protein YckC